MSTPDVVERCVDHLRGVFAGRKVIVALGPVAGSGRTGTRLAELGAEPPLVLAECTGTGELPNKGEVADWHVVGKERVDTLMDGVRAFVHGLVHLPPDAARAIERYDPDRTALVITANYLDLTSIAGRRVFGARRPEWAALEDKVVVDAMWDAAGVRRALSSVVPVRRDDLLEAASALDRGAGTVWAADARDGRHGGGDGTRWLRPGADPDEAVTFMAERADHVRIMPFLEGIPCGIHGIVLADNVIALRPVEQITLRCSRQMRFHYGGTATFWDPPGPDREAMRALAARVGAHLRASVGYRGAFTIDGVLTADGFLPTELNPRFGAGLHALQVAIPELPLYMLNLAIMADEVGTIDGPALESLLLERADTTRGGIAKGLTTAVRTVTEVHPIVERTDGQYEAAGDRESDAVVTIGPSPVGSLVMFAPNVHRTPVGPSLAPRAVNALAWADEHLGTGFGGLEAAEGVR